MDPHVIKLKVLKAPFQSIILSLAGSVFPSRQGTPLIALEWFLLPTTLSFSLITLRRHSHGHCFTSPGLVWRRVLLPFVFPPLVFLSWFLSSNIQSAGSQVFKIREITKYLKLPKASHECAYYHLSCKVVEILTWCTHIITTCKGRKGTD